MRLFEVLTSLLFISTVFGETILQDNKDEHQTQLASSSSDKLSSIISASPLLSLHRVLVEVESITDNELSVAKLLISILKAHDFKVTTQEVPSPPALNNTKPRWNVYATPDPAKYKRTKAEKTQSSTPKVLLTSHIDTVPPFIPYSLSIPSEAASKSSTKVDRKNVLISGRGTVDDKACVAAQFQALLELLADSEHAVDPSDVALLFVVGEEVRGDGMTHFSTSQLYKDTKADYKAIIFGEPTEGKLATGHKGIVMLNLAATGKAAHSGYPWLGKSAVSMIIPALTVLDRLGDLAEDEGGLPRSDRYGNTTVNIGHMTGGVAANVVPAHAEAQIAFRLAGGPLSKVRTIISNAIKGVDPEGLLETDYSQGYGPVPLDYDVEGFDSMPVNYGTDVPNLEIDEGVKRYLYGPGSILVAHGANEGLTVGDMEQAVVDYKKLVLHSLNL